MNSTLTWRLETTDLNNATLLDVVDRTPNYYQNTDIETFFRLIDVWAKLGFRLKKERCGYSAIKGNKFYVLFKMI